MTFPCWQPSSFPTNPATTTTKTTKTLLTPLTHTHSYTLQEVGSSYKQHQAACLSGPQPCHRSQAHPSHKRCVLLFKLLLLMLMLLLLLLFKLLFLLLLLFKLLLLLLLLLLLCCCCCCCCSSSCCSSSLARTFLFGPGQRYLPFLDALCHFLFWDCCCSKNSLFWFVWDKFATFLFLCCHAFLLVSAPRRPSSLPQLSQLLLLLLLLFSLSFLRFLPGAITEGSATR